MVTTGIIVLLLVAGLLALVFVLQERLIFFPEKLPRDYGFSFGPHTGEIFLPRPDGAELHALYLRAERPVGVVLYFHGNAGSLRGWGHVAELFLQLGYSVCIPDYRTYGKSTGRLSEAALHADAEALLQHLLPRTQGLPLVIYGRSIGTGVAVKLAAEHAPAALVLESPYLNLYDLAAAHLPYLPARLLLRYTFRSDRWIQQVRCPVYIIHGTADEIVPFESGQKLAALGGERVKLVPVPGGGHNDLEAYPQYRVLLQEALGKAAAGAGAEGR